MDIARFTADAPLEEMQAALREVGILIVEKLVPDDTMDRIESEIAPDLEAKEPGGGKFFGFKCKRLGGAVGRSPTFAHQLGDPILTGLADALLLDNCKTYQLQISGILQVWKGGEPQPLHRDIGVYEPYLERKPGGPEILVSLMWAVTDFTAENGATRLVPGSHLWESERKAKPEEEIQAVMPRGSLAIWRGNILHGMGVNHTDTPRTGLVGGFSVGWLRQEENQYLVCPPEKAQHLPERVQQLLGYKAHSPILGWVEDRDSDLLLRAGNRDNDNDNAAYDDQTLQY